MAQAPDHPSDLTASDVFATGVWSSRGGKQTLGVDIACTKISIDLQNLRRGTVEPVIRESLNSLRDSAGVDTAFVWMLSPEGTVIDEVYAAHGALAQCRVETWRGTALEGFPWLNGRLEHLRLSEIRDSAAPRKDQAVECHRLAEQQIGSVLMISFRIQGQPAGVLGLANALPRGAWDVNLQLLLKLLGNSLATGLEKLRVEQRLRKLEERLELAQGAANDGLWDFDIESNEVHFSPRWKQMLGYPVDAQLDSPDWRSLVHPEDMSRVQSAIRDHVAGKSPIFESVHRMKHRNGDWRWVVSRAKARVDEHGRLLRLVGVELDITERKLYEEALFREKESAQITLQSIGDGVITTDANSTVDYINPVAEQLTGWRLEDAMGRPIEEIYRAFHEETCEPLENPLSVSIRRTRPIKSVRPMLLIRRDGNELYVESTAAPIRDGAGAVSGGVLVFHDVTESRELNRRLSYHASHDLLTGLVNRREFESRIERALKSAKARESSYALCYLDIDQFKIINDTCGHSAGDVLLGQVGALLKSKVRWRDTLARRGAAHGGSHARGRPQFPLYVGRPRVPSRRVLGRGAHRRGQRGRRVHSFCRRLGLRRGEGSRPQSRAQLCRERHRAHAPPARDAVGGAHQLRAGRGSLRAVSHDDPAVAAGRTRSALRTTAAHARRIRPHGLARQFHRRRRTLHADARDRSLGHRERAALAGLRSGRARDARDVLDKPVRSESGRRQVPAVRDRAVPEERHRRL
ncbi:MAG: PAS domain S-box protein [Steroidobacteraceae bacterium]|nr:PAS domain S-box protein [Steroidobacteraceae bacterium]